MYDLDFEPIEPTAPTARWLSGEDAEALSARARSFGRVDRGPLDGGPDQLRRSGVTGSVVADVADGTVRTGRNWSHIEIAVDGLRSGNRAYDAELLRRIDARRFPTASIDLRDCVAIGAGNRYRLAGELTFHGVTRPAQGTVHVAVVPERRLVITGEQGFDIRDFAVPSPTVLMLRIYPDVRVRLHIEAEFEEGER
jgi:hypothetical protein